jgi:hypothetical protein
VRDSDQDFEISNEQGEVYKDVCVCINDRKVDEGTPKCRYFFRGTKVTSDSEVQTVYLVMCVKYPS